MINPDLLREISKSIELLSELDKQKLISNLDKIEKTLDEIDTLNKEPLQMLDDLKKFKLFAW